MIRVAGDSGLRADTRKPVYYEAECASGTLCGAESGQQLRQERVVEWMQAHTAETRHDRFFVLQSGYVRTATPP